MSAVPMVLAGGAAVLCRRRLSAQSKRKAVAAQAEESGVAVAGGFDASHELMPSVMAAVRMTFRVVLMLHRDSGAGGLAHVERCAIAAEDFDG